MKSVAMKNVLTKSRSMLGALVLAGFCQAGQAAVVYEDTDFITGTDSFTESFDIVTNGSYRATLTDLDFPASFETLGLAITSSTVNFGDILGSGSFMFDATPGTYFANVFGVTDPVFDFGLFGVKVELMNEGVSNVPVPAPVLLLASGLAALFGVRRRKIAQSNPVIA